MTTGDAPVPVPTSVRVRLESRGEHRWKIPAFLLFVVACSQVALSRRAFVHDWMVHYRRHDAYRMENFQVWEAIGGEIRGTAWLHLAMAVLALGLVVWILSKRRVPTLPALGVALAPLVVAALVLHFDVPADPSAPRAPRFLGSVRRFALAPPALVAHGVALVVLVLRLILLRRQRGPDLQALSDAF
mgnify:CR=1 FL=1